MNKSVRLKSSGRWTDRSSRERAKPYQIQCSQHPSELNGVARLGEHAKAGIQTSSKNGQGARKHQLESQLRFLSMAKLRTAELVVPTPIACTFTLWKRQQRPVSEMDFLLPVVSAFAHGLSCYSLSSLTQS